MNSKSKNKTNNNYKMITGLTKNVEGEITVDDMQATTNIGKIRKNQEDAVLLIKDKLNPEFKMMVVADGMGGEDFGEVASNEIINILKKWFENLTDEQRNAFNTTVADLKNDLIKVIQMDIQIAVESKTWQSGGSTLVCAIIGKNDTLIANVGDSRAYIAKKGKLIQVTRDDTFVQKQVDKGKIATKDVARFNKDASILSQCVGMNRKYIEETHIHILDNSQYDLLLLFTDGVTDCLSDEDIVAVCKTSDKKELANKIVEKALNTNSILPEDITDYKEYNVVISGGKDNATAAVYTPKKPENDGEAR